MKRKAFRPATAPDQRSWSKKGGHNVGWFYDETYRENIYLVWEVGPEKLEAFMKHQFGVVAGFVKGEVFGGRTVDLDNPDNSAYGQVIALSEWKPDAKHIAMLAHECLHATDHILNCRGMKLTRDTPEAYTYLLESLTRRCLQLLSL